MGKKCLIGLAVLLLCGAAVFAWGNSRTREFTVEKIELTREEALRACPAVEITEDDRAMMAELFALPAVREAMAQKEITELPEETISAVKGRYAPEADRFHAYVTEHVLYVDRYATETSRTTFSFFADEERLTEKLVATYKTDRYDHKNLKTLYGTDGAEAFYKFIEKRDWFAFLDGLHF